MSNSLSSQGKEQGSVIHTYKMLTGRSMEVLPSDEPNREDNIPKVLEPDNHF